jgi:nucleoside-diphosphate-sugar epimerase
MILIGHNIGKKMSNAIIFGGNGFFGLFMAIKLSEKNSYEKIFLYDNESIESKNFDYRIRKFKSIANIIFIKGCVKDEIKSFEGDDNISLILNLAAIHREPGHFDWEYYETNLKGATNITKWADKIGCKDIIFASSISPYGLSEDIRDENSLTVPTSAYGGSKLVAEKIHQIWQSNNINDKKLIIVRPGVIFGPSEGGNVSRLIKAIKGNYFFYMGNHNTRKAGIYIKELTNFVMWLYEDQILPKNKNYILANATMNPGPSVSEYVDTIKKILKRDIYIINIPYSFLLFISRIIDLILGIFKIKHPFSPVRIKKLVNSNNILSSYAKENNYKYVYSLESALNDWKKECPEEW